MNYLSKDITAQILFDHFQYFQKSLLSYFEKYKNIVFLEGVTIPFHLAYLCPLCLKKYIVQLGNNLNVNGFFSIDHVPPKSVGGTLELITCKKCNNDAGKFEAELIKKLKYDAFAKKQFPVVIEDTKFRISGVKGNYASFIKRIENEVPIIDFPSNKKQKTPLLDNWLNNLNDQDDWSVTLEVPVPNSKKNLKALLKAAYLICFFYWGYEFLYSNSGEMIRKVLNDEAIYPMDGPAFWVDKNDLEKGIIIPIGIGIIENPSELQSYCVTIPVEKNNNSYIAILLIPNPTEHGWQQLKKIHSWLTDNPQKQVTFRPLNISLPNIIDGYMQEWNSFINSTQN